MTVISSGTWPIDATTTSGTELAAYLNEMVDAIQTSQASPTRPPAIQKGGVWTKTLGAADIALMLYDGTTDIEIGRVVGGNATFGGTAVSTTAPTPATAGMLWVDSTTGGKPQLKMYDGTVWQLVYVKDDFKRVVQAGVVNDAGPYTTTTQTFHSAAGPGVTVTPKSPGNTKLIGVFTANVRATVSKATADAGTDLALKYFDGAAYIDTGEPRVVLFTSVLTGTAQIDHVVSTPFELSNAQRRSDTGDWLVKLHFSCKYPDNSSAVSRGSMIFWEVEE